MKEVLLPDALIYEVVGLEGPVRHLRSLVILDNQQQSLQKHFNRLLLQLDDILPAGVGDEIKLAVF